VTNLLDNQLGRKRFAYMWRVGRVATTTWCGFLVFRTGLILDFEFLAGYAQLELPVLAWFIGVGV
jgi:hypothetical protein